MTRLPPPHRVQPAMVLDFLADRCPEPYLALDAAGHRDLLARLAELGITGGAAYDALVAATAAAHGARLISCDSRAMQTYQQFGVEYRIL